jgi:Tol biopolymer transport system component
VTHAARLTLVVVLGSCLLTGCLASTVVLHVKPDGSGTAVASLRVNKATYEQFSSTLGQPAAVERPEDSYPAPDMSTDHEVFLEFEAPVGDAPPQAPARQAPPDTEIYLASLTISGGQLTIGQPVNISTSPGYDNQPSFTPDGQSILFTSARDGTQTDIYRFDLSTKHITRLTHTPESEYSPGTTPDGRLSVVRVEADGTQRLWSFTIDGRDPHVLLERVKPVGYYAWADDHTVALYVLGAAGTDQPSTLQLADTRTGDARSIATDVGRSLLTIPGRHAVSVVQRERKGETSAVTIAELDPSSGAIRPLAPRLQGATEADGAWMPDGTLLTVSQDRLLAWRQGDREWAEVAPLDRLGLRSATRLAVSPDGHWIALVAAPQ